MCLIWVGRNSVPKKKVSRKLSVSVVGLQHRVTMTTRRMMAARISDGGPMEVKLEREPDNHVDPNAIRVIVTGGPYSKLHIGYVPRRVAEILAPALDKKQAELGMCLLTGVTPEDGEGELLIRLRTGVKFPAKRLISES